MARTPISKRARLKRLTDRLDWLELFFRTLSRDLPGRLIDTLAKGRVVASERQLREDGLNELDGEIRAAFILIAAARRIIKTERFKAAALLCHEVENKYRFVTQTIELIIKRRRAKWDHERRQAGGRDSHRGRDENRADCLAYIDRRLSEDPSLPDAQLNENARLKYGVNVATVRRWRREDAAL